MKTRVLSALIAIAIFVPLLLFSNETIFNILVVIISVLAFNEVINVRESYKKIPTLIKVVAYFAMLLIVLNNVAVLDSFTYTFNLNYLAVVFLFLTLPTVLFRNISKYSINDAAYLIIVIFYIGLTFNAAINVRSYGVEYFFYALFMAYITDTMAFFSGKFFGKHKLIPEISPKKTIEGAIGGTIFGTLVGTLFLIFIPRIFDLVGLNISLWLIILISLLLSIVSQFGDLVASAIKRRYSIKDFGNIMPGHGGVLDRIDSVMFVILLLSIILNMVI